MALKMVARHHLICLRRIGQSAYQLIPAKLFIAVLYAFTGKLSGLDGGGTEHTHESYD